MRLYGEHQAGGSLTAICPGDSLTLFDGTEAPAAGITSLAFARGTGPGGSNTPLTFQGAFPAAMNATIEIQGSNIDAEAAYEKLGEIKVQYGNYIDTGTWAFYRAKITAYVSGGMPVVKVQR